MREEVLAEIQKLRRLFYLAASLRGEDGETVRNLYATALAVSNHRLPELRDHVRGLINQVRTETGCKLSDGQIAEVVEGMLSAGDGYLYLPKWFIDEQWFDRYERVFPRWPHVPLHTLVIFDSDITQESPYGFFVAEAMLFRDVATLWADIEDICRDGHTFRGRSRQKQHRLSSLLRTSATLVYHFLEAYLNGFAFEYGRKYHDALRTEDHDLLAEWNSERKQQRFVAFERKLREYPAIVGKYLGRGVAFRDDPDVAYLVGEGKLLRDAMTHPAPHFPAGRDSVGKLARVVAVSRDDVKRLIDSAINYVRKVESALGRDAGRTVPWLDLQRGLDL